MSLQSAHRQVKQAMFSCGTVICGRLTTPSCFAGGILVPVRLCAYIQIRDPAKIVQPAGIGTAGGLGRNPHHEPPCDIRTPTAMASNTTVVGGAVVYSGNAPGTWPARIPARLSLTPAVCPCAVRTWQATAWSVSSPAGALPRRLVQDYPDSGISWHAIGCYYYATAQYDAARNYFGKATQLAPRHAPAWIAYGHAFAAQDESDQALAAYRTAARLFPGLHQPVLGMGREYQHMNNHMLAEQMYLQVRLGCMMVAVRFW